MKNTLDFHISLVDLKCRLWQKLNLKFGENYNFGRKICYLKGEAKFSLKLLPYLFHLRLWVVLNCLKAFVFRWNQWPKSGGDKNKLKIKFIKSVGKISVSQSLGEEWVLNIWTFLIGFSWQSKLENFGTIWILFFIKFKKPNTFLMFSYLMLNWVSLPPMHNLTYEKQVGFYIKAVDGGLRMVPQ